VSILIRIGDGERVGRGPSNISMLIIRPPQHGHRRAGKRCFGLAVGLGVRALGRDLGRSKQLAGSLSPTAPLLAGAGIVGIAVGFGSQKLVQDVVTGLFLLLENAIQVGDFVTVSGLSGTVEDLSIQTIRLRAGDGSVHITPFSSVTSVTNTNRGIGNSSVSVNLAYNEDTDRASEVLS
jgi:hypothetical protein